MQQAFIVTAIAGACDPHRGITNGQRIYAEEFEWRGKLERAKWYANRDDAIKVIVGRHGAPATDFLYGDPIRADQWEVIELSYDTVITSISDEDRDNLIRANALNRLSSEERRVLGF